MSKKRYLKQIQSFQELIRKHNEKIENERGKPIPDLNLIKYWEKEVQIFFHEIIKAEKRLKRGG